MPSERFDVWATRMRETHLNFVATPEQRERFEQKLLHDWPLILEDEKREAKREQEERRWRFLGLMPQRPALAALNTTDDDRTIRIVAPIRDRAEGIIVLAGPVGVGKTVAACWLAWQRERFAWFVPAEKIATTSRYDDEACAPWREGRALIVDDLGAEYLDAKGSLAADIDALVDRFHSRCWWLVITTNLTPAAFRDRYGARVVDRMREAGEWVSITGPSRRGQP